MPITHAFVSTKGDIADSSYVRPTNWNAAHVVSDIASTPTGRLTLTTATPVLTSTVSGATTIYYTPYAGNTIGIYDGTNVASTTFTELSVATTDTTKSPAAIGASKVNDWFVWNDSGTLRVGHGPDWTNDTTRSAGTALVRVGGLLLNNASITNGPAASRGTYVGTTRSDASSQLNWVLGTAASGGGAAIFGIWNAYNRVSCCTVVRETDDSWVVPSPTVRSFNNSNNNRVSLVAGLQEDWVNASIAAMASGWVANNPHSVGVGYNSTSALSANCTNGGIFSASVHACLVSFDVEQPFGYVFLQALECNGDTSGPVTYYGDAAAATYASAGLTVHFRA